MRCFSLTSMKPEGGKPPLITPDVLSLRFHDDMTMYKGQNDSNLERIIVIRA